MVKIEGKSRRALKSRDRWKPWTMSYEGTWKSKQTRSKQDEGMWSYVTGSGLCEDVLDRISGLYTYNRVSHKRSTSHCKQRYTLMSNFKLSNLLEGDAQQASNFGKNGNFMPFGKVAVWCKSIRMRNMTIRCFF